MEMCHEGNSINILIKAARAQESFEAAATVLNKWIQLNKKQRAAQLLWHRLSFGVLWRQCFCFSTTVSLPQGLALVCACSIMVH